MVLTKNLEKKRESEARRAAIHADLDRVEQATLKSNFKRDFVTTSNNMNDETKKLIQALRNGILSANGNGEFLELGISPAVLTDDFVLRASTFMKLYQQNTNNNRIIVGYWIKDNTVGPISDCWLLAVLEGAAWQGRPGVIEKQPETLPLLTLPAKRYNVDNEYFNILLEDVVGILEKFFSHVERKSQTTAGTSPSKNDSSKVFQSGMELQDALLKAQVLRERGVYRRLDHNSIDMEETTKGQVKMENTISVPVAEAVVKRNTRIPPELALLLKAIFLALCLFAIHRAWFAGIA